MPATSSLNPVALAARTIHIKMYPIPRSVPERREVIRVLERFGEVQMFKSLKYEWAHPVHNAFISIMGTESEAAALINASPIRYQLLPNHPSPSPSEFEGDSSTTAPRHSAAEPSLFELNISQSSYPHRDVIASSPLYGPFKPIACRHSRIADDLAKRIPRGIAWKGLCDWETERMARRTGGAGGLDYMIKRKRKSGRSGMESVSERVIGREEGRGPES